MTRAAVIVGAFEHPRRRIADISVPQIIREVAMGALADAGLRLDDVDAYFTSAETPGLGALGMVDYLGLRNLRYIDNTEGGGAAYPMHVGHAAAAIAQAKCDVALVTMGGAPLSRPWVPPLPGPDTLFEGPAGTLSPVSNYALVARRHMYEFGTTSAQLAEVKSAISWHAQFNENAFLRTPVTVEEVLESPMISDPLHRLDSCITTDGGGALIIVSEDVAARLGRRGAQVRGHGETIEHTTGGRFDLVTTGAARSGPRAFEEAGVTPADIDMVSIYDSFTITVLLSLEDLGFCAKGEGGRFVEDGRLRAPYGALPLNTDGGGLNNNHPDFRGGMIRTIEAVRQVRGEAHPSVQIPDCELVLVQGQGGHLATRSASATVILERYEP